MFAILLAGIAVPAGAFFWYKIVVPLDRMLKHTEDEQHPDWSTDQHPNVLVPDPRCQDDISHSLVNLSNIVTPSSLKPSSESHSTRDREVAPAA